MANAIIDTLVYLIGILFLVGFFVIAAIQLYKFIQEMLNDGKSTNRDGECPE